MMIIRNYKTSDFPAIDHLNQEEGWRNLVNKKEQTKKAWDNSNIAYVAEEEGEIVGCLRGLTDGYVTLFISELLIKKSFRGKGIGRELLLEVQHQYPETRLDLLATSTSQSYYEKLDFRPFYGYRKTIQEW